MKVVAPAADAATAPGAANTADAVFAAPWEARAFALAVTLSGGERFAWDDFRDLLIAEIAAGDAAAAHAAPARRRTHRGSALLRTLAGRAGEASVREGYAQCGGNRSTGSRDRSLAARSDQGSGSRTDQDRLGRLSIAQVLRAARAAGSIT